MLIVVAALAVAGAVAKPAAADEDDEARARAECTRGHEAELRVRRDEGRLLVELRIESPRLARWSVILLHERRIAFRGTVRATRSGGVRLRRAFPDFYGRDRAVVRATGPRAEVCRLGVTL
jgi:2-methylaconitate cis-trans-isomerase PrpF